MTRTDLAQYQARRRAQMQQNGWIEKLDRTVVDFLESHLIVLTILAGIIAMVIVGRGL